MMEEQVVIHAWDLKPLYEMNCKYFEMARNLQKRYPYDLGLQKRVLSHWYKNKSNKKNWYLHNLLNQIISFAEENKLLIIQEQLKGLKKGINKKVMKENPYNKQLQLHRKFPRKILGRLNRAVFNQVQHMLNYKAEWKNIPYVYVSAQNNSQMCPICGEKNTSAEWHTFTCKCGVQNSRHLVACLNMCEKKRKKHEDESHSYRLDREKMCVLKPILSTKFPV